MEAPESALTDLAKVLERDRLVYQELDALHLVRVAPPSIVRQHSLAHVVACHIEYGKEHTAQLQYYPCGFLVAHDVDCETNSAYLVYADVEEPHAVTSFRLKICDAPEVCWAVREDDDGIKVLRDRFKIEDGQQFSR